MRNDQCCATEVSADVAGVGAHTPVRRTLAWSISAPTRDAAEIIAVQLFKLSNEGAIPPMAAGPLSLILPI